MANNFFYKGTDITEMISSGGGSTSRSPHGFNYTYNKTASTYDNIDSNCALSNCFKDSGPNDIQAAFIGHDSNTDQTFTDSVPAWANGFKIILASRKGSNGNSGEAGADAAAGNRPYGASPSPDGGSQYWCPGGYVTGAAGNKGTRGLGGVFGSGGAGVITYSNVMHTSPNLNNTAIVTTLKSTHTNVTFGGNHSITVNAGNAGNNGNNGNDAQNGQDAQACTSQYSSQKGSNGANGADGANGYNGNNGNKGNAGTAGYVSANVPVTSVYTYDNNTASARIFFFAV